MSSASSSIAHNSCGDAHIAERERDGPADDPRLFKLPPYLALLCILGGIVWIGLLPLDEYSRRTYISENALLPGQVHTYFAGSEQNIFRAYRHEIASVIEPKGINDDQGNPTGQYLVATEGHRNDRIERILNDAGIKTARQKYSYAASGKTYEGENIYAIVHGPRADGTESIVLVAPVKNIEDQLNVNGVTLIVTLARYFSRWSLWSKDIIILITPDSAAGPQAFVDAYHSMHDAARVADLSLKSGHIQGAVVIDYPFDHRFETLHVAYDGINGQLPNLDLINTATSIASGQMGIGTTIQGQHTFTGSGEHAKYLVRLQTLARGMLQQALGRSTGAHSVFMPYHIDAITLTAVGHGWQDEMAFGRTVESVTRSINNLLEKLHQSFFFFLLLQNTRFVSIGTYLPSAMAVGASFTIVAIFAWVSSGYEVNDVMSGTEEISNNGGSAKEDAPLSAASASSKKAWTTIDRPLALPVALFSTIHLTSMLSIFLLANIHLDSIVFVTLTRSLAGMLLPILLAIGLKQYVSNSLSTTSASLQTRLATIYNLLKSLSLLVLGLELTVLATLNFSLSMFLGLLCTPLAFVSFNPLNASVGSSPSSQSAVLKTVQNIVSLLSLVTVSPPVMVIIASAVEIYYLAPYRAPIGIMGRVREYLEAEAFTFNVLGGWGTSVGVWCIWVPAWIVSMTGVVGSFLNSKGQSSNARPVPRITTTAPETNTDGNDTKSGRNKMVDRLARETDEQGQSHERERSRSGSRRRRQQQKLRKQAAAATATLAVGGGSPGSGPSKDTPSSRESSRSRR